MPMTQARKLGTALLAVTVLSCGGGEYTKRSSTPRSIKLLLKR